MSSYDYVNLDGVSQIGSVVSTALFDGQYGYGQETIYNYGTDLDGAAMTTMTITQETRNTPSFRALDSYQLTIHQNGFIKLVSLGTQILPI
jgi:hypothetical protein